MAYKITIKICDLPQLWKKDGEKTKTKFILTIAILEYKEGILSRGQLESKLNGWFGYAKFCDSFKLQKDIIDHTHKNINSQ